MMESNKTLKLNEDVSEAANDSSTSHSNPFELSNCAEKSNY